MQTRTIGRANRQKTTRDVAGGLAIAALVVGWSLMTGAALPVKPPERWVASVDTAASERLNRLVGDSLLSVTGLALSTRGDVAVADASSHRVWLVRADGTVQVLGGRRGAGPGEFATPCCVTFTSGGRLVVADAANRRFAVYADLGASFRLERVVAMPFDMRASTDRTPVGRAGEIHLLGETPAASAGMSTFRLQSLAGQPRERSPWSLPGPTIDSIDRVAVGRSVRGGAGALFLDTPFGSRLVLSVLSDGAVARAVSGTGVVELVSRAGRRLLVKGLGAPGPRVSPRERQLAQAGLRGATGPFEALARRVSIPDRKPPIDAIGEDGLGRIWVKLSVADGAREQTAYVFRRDGTLDGTARWPASVSLISWAVVANRAVGVTEDEDGNIRLVALAFAVER